MIFLRITYSVKNILRINTSTKRESVVELFTSTLKIIETSQRLTVIQQTMSENQDQPGAASAGCIKKIPEEIAAFVPPILGPCNSRLRSSDEFVKLVKACYKLLSLKDVVINGNNHQILSLKFIGKAPQSLNGIKMASTSLANVKPNVAGLNNLLESIIRGSRDFRVSHLAANCVQGFTNQDINSKLVETFAEPNDSQEEPEYLYILMVERLIPKCLNALLFVHKKARLLVEAYYEVEHLKEDIAKLTS